MSILDLIDGVIERDGDAMRWAPYDWATQDRAEVTLTIEPALDSHGRIAYQNLTTTEREALHSWVDLHNVAHARVPIDPEITYDETTNEYRIEAHHLRDGRVHLNDDHTAAATVILRRAAKAELPWRRP